MLASIQPASVNQTKADLGITNDSEKCKNALKQSITLVRSAKTGELIPVRGLGAMKDSPLPLKKGIDLTKPIAAQVFKIKRK